MVVFTNNLMLKYFLSKKDVKSRLIRWILLIQEFNLEIRDKKGEKKMVTDHLSLLTFDTDMVPIRNSFLDELLVYIKIIP